MDRSYDLHDETNTITLKTDIFYIFIKNPFLVFLFQDFFSNNLEVPLDNLLNTVLQIQSISISLNDNAIK